MKPPFAPKLILAIPAAMALAFPLGSCSATSGAAAGALIGAGLGQLAGGDTESTVVGAALGAVIGGAIGFNVQTTREARVIASREATSAELQAVTRAASTVSAAAREKALTRVKAYAAEHAEEKNGGNTEVIPLPENTQVTEETLITEEPLVTEEKLGTEETLADPKPVLLEAIRLPGSDGVILRNLETGRFLDEEVHTLEDIKDVSGKTPKTIEASSDEAKLPFTLILSNQKTGETRQYTAIYSS
ncbi:hypothetical protein Poly30_00700 [Planctomycetes bacterium Poly30]|uniref:Glycine zipper domain-containing protein n=1 Tax=Saltatorellus ferox TaxID=2528018 RepID=A0A518EKG1_9BACT|nr:hypothetical protein Poly30_00700 [Planctomycetes bacterium Poly30]